MQATASPSNSGFSTFRIVFLGLNAAFFLVLVIMALGLHSKFTYDTGVAQPTTISADSAAGQADTTNLSFMPLGSSPSVNTAPVTPLEQATAKINGLPNDEDFEANYDPYLVNFMKTSNYYQRLSQGRKENALKYNMFWNVGAVEFQKSPDSIMKKGVFLSYCDQVAKAGFKRFNKTFYTVNLTRGVAGGREKWMYKFMGWIEVAPAYGWRWSPTSKKWIDCSKKKYRRGHRKLFCAPLDVGVIFSHDMGTIYGGYKKPWTVGVEYGCAGQFTDYIAGIDTHVGNKKNVADDLKRYYKAFERRGLQHCFPQFHTMLPQTWDLAVEEECQDFFVNFAPEARVNPKVRYLIKYINAHVGRGVLPLTNKTFESNLKQFKYGEACGKKGLQHVLIQKLVEDPFILKKRKSDSRTFALIGSTKPFTAFLSPEFYMRTGAVEYDPDSQAAHQHLTNVRVNMEYNRLKDDEFPNIILHQDQFAAHITKTEKADGRQLVNQFLEYQAGFMMHLFRVGQKFMKYPQHQAFITTGNDFLMDSKHVPWFLECNTYPDVRLDMCDTVSAQTRWTGLVLTQYYDGVPSKELNLQSRLNGKKLIPLIDDGREGEDRYFGRLPAECLDPAIMDEVQISTYLINTDFN